MILLSLVRSNADGKLGFTAVDNRVCVALSRARLGFFCACDLEMLGAGSKLWATLQRHVRKESRSGAALPLQLADDGDAAAAAKKTTTPPPSSEAGGAGRWGGDDWQSGWRRCVSSLTAITTAAATAADGDSSKKGGLRCCGTRLPCGHTCALCLHPIGGTSTVLCACSSGCTADVAVTERRRWQPLTATLQALEHGRAPVPAAPAAAAEPAAASAEPAFPGAQRFVAPPRQSSHRGSTPPPPRDRALERVAAEHGRIPRNVSGVSGCSDASEEGSGGEEGGAGDSSAAAQSRVVVYSSRNDESMPVAAPAYENVRREARDERSADKRAAKKAKREASDARREAAPRRPGGGGRRRRRRAVVGRRVRRRRRRGGRAAEAAARRRRGGRRRRRRRVGGGGGGGGRGGVERVLERLAPTDLLREQGDAREGVAAPRARDDRAAEGGRRWGERLAAPADDGVSVFYSRRWWWCNLYSSRKTRTAVGCLSRRRVRSCLAHTYFTHHA